MKKFEPNAILKIAGYETHLKHIKAGIKSEISTDNPIFGPLVDSVTNIGGKLVRSTLLLAVLDSQKIKVDKKVYAACVSVEVAHLASLVHDDLLDDAQTRRGQATVNGSVGDDKALLFGDYLFSRSHLAASKAGQDISEIMANTVSKMCEGQALETADNYNQKRSMTAYYKSIEGKTCSLIIAPLLMAASISNMDIKKTKLLEEFGTKFGTVFQIMDDLMDLLSTNELLGKPVHQDLKQGVYTAPILHAMADKKTASVVLPYLQIAKNLQFDHDKLVSDLKEIGAIKSTNEDALVFARNAEASLKTLPELSALSQLPAKYIQWVMANLVEVPSVPKPKG